MTGKELIEYLKRNYNNDAPIAYDIFTVDHIRGRALETGISLTDTQCADVLGLMNNKSDFYILRYFFILNTTFFYSMSNNFAE